MKPSPNALNPWPTRFNDKGVGSCFITSHSWLKPEKTAGPSVVATLNNVAILLDTNILKYVLTSKSRMKLYDPFVSKNKNKKYSVYVMKGGKKRLIHFGDSRYQQYRDKLKHYSHLDHNDSKKRKSYYARHGPSNDKNTAKFWAHKILW